MEERPRKEEKPTNRWRQRHVFEKGKEIYGRMFVLDLPLSNIDI